MSKETNSIYFLFSVLHWTFESDTMAKFFNKLFNRGSSFNGSQTSLSDTPTRSKTSSTVRASASLENLASYHVTSKELEKNKLHKAAWEGNYQKVMRLARPGQINLKDQQMRVGKSISKNCFNTLVFLRHRYIWQWSKDISK